MKCLRCGRDMPDDAFFCAYCGTKAGRTGNARKTRARRRARGTGFIKKLNGQRSRPYAAYSAGRKLIGTFATSGEATNALDTFNANMVPAARINYTFDDVYRVWSEKHYPKLSTDGVKGYELAYSRCEALKRAKIAALKTADYQTVIDEMAGRGLSRSSCEKQKQLFSQLCLWGMENDIVMKNYATFLELPAAAAAKTRVFTEEEIEKIAGMADDKRLGETARIALAMIYSGMRINELLTLRTENVHLEQRYVVGGEKTEAGRDRAIPIHEKIVPFFTAWMLDNDTPYMLPSAYGLPRDKNNVRKSFNALMKKLGIEGATPHTCRHTAATRMVENGVRQEIIKQILGHADYSTTVNKYTHMDISALVGGLDSVP